MLISLALMLLIGLLMSEVFHRLGLPGFVAMILSGIVIGPYVLNWLDPNLLTIAPDLREIALIVILLRVGLQLDFRDLKQVGRPAFLLSFVPATFEAAAATVLAHYLLGLPWLAAALLGAILAAVSPAVVVPRMLSMMEKGIGKEKRIPHMIVAGASADDIFVIVLFSALLSMQTSGIFDPWSIALIPVSILSGGLAGLIVGLGLVVAFRKIHIRDTAKVLILLGAAFFLVWADHATESWLPYSGLIAVIVMGGTILKTYGVLAERLVAKFSKVWVFAELLLFVLVGAAVDIRVIPQIGWNAFFVIVGALLVRMLGVFVAVSKTNLNAKERLFVALSYLPKATVQAAIGSIPLAMGIQGGETILAAAVLAILFTAPLGAVLIDNTWKPLIGLPKQV
jgi:solute carrier family 9B (sodium/hydrogen exchanger), member 1/2